MFGSSLLMAASNTSYSIANSCRFRSAGSTYLSRTPSVAGNRQKWTLSFWVKKCTNPGTSKAVFGCGTNYTNDLTVGYGFNGTYDYFEMWSRDGGIQIQLATSAVYRDVAGWYHLTIAVDTTQATAANRVVFYVNGVQVTSYSTATYPAQNYNTLLNTTSNTHYWGVARTDLIGSAAMWDGYLSDCYLIDGAALTPSSFGQTDANGVWTPKAYSGTYGTNGVKLAFSSSGALGTDSSGNGNTYTSSGLASTDQVSDSPTNNFATWNPLIRSTSGNAAYSSGNLVATKSPASWQEMVGTMAVRSGKFGFKVTVTTTSSTSPGYYIGVCNPDNIGNNDRRIYGNNGNKRGSSGVDAAYGATFTTGDVIEVLLDIGAGTLEFKKNGTSQGTAFTDMASALPAGGWMPYVVFDGSASSPVATLDCGQNGYSPSDATYKPLCTANLPAASITKGSAYQNEVLWTGDGVSGRVITGVGHQPDFVWIKNRNGTNEHFLFDSVRGLSHYLMSNATSAEDSPYGAVSNFIVAGSDGFTINSGGGGTNANTNTYVGWCWKKGATPGFDIVTGTAGAGAQSHTLGAKPALIIEKNRGTAGTNWAVTHKSLSANMQDSYLILNSTAAKATSAGIWGGEPTASDFYVSTTVNGSGTFVAYLWAEVPSFSKFGSYTGNGNADGPFVYCGFRPRYILTKISAGATGSWVVIDTSRDVINVTGNFLLPDSAGAEASNTMYDICSNGFKLRGTAINNTNTYTYIYAAFAENPMGGSNVAPVTAR